MQGTKSDNSSDDESLTNRMSRKHVLPKSRLLEAIEKVLESQEKKPVGREAKIIASYNRHKAIRIDCNCADRSHLPLCSSRNVDTGLMPIFNELRLCLLAGDWDNYKELLLVLFSSPNIANDYILFAVRSCFVLLFNHPCRSPDILDNFMASCLKINDESRRIQYLEGCFSLKGDSAYTSKKNILKEESEKEDEDEDEEEIFFYSDFSSDENV